MKVDFNVAREHAYLSPSSAEGWMTCSGRPYAELAYPAETNVYAEEGTLAHALAAECLTEKMDPLEYVGEELVYTDHGKVTIAKIEKYMAIEVGKYVDYVKKHIKDLDLLVEQRMSLTPVTGEPNAYGTSDIVAFWDNKLVVMDLKFGMGYVEVEDNKQLRIYALQALEEFSWFGDIEEVEIHICQPRLNAFNKYCYTKKELMVFAREVKERAAISLAMLKGEREPEYTPGEKACQWCRARGTCAVRRKYISEMVEAGRDSLSDIDFAVKRHEIQQQDIDELEKTFLNASEIEAYIKAVKDAVHARLMSGNDSERVKLILGRMGNRAWSSEDKVYDTVAKHNLPKEAVTKHTLLSPTEMEREFKKVNPALWDALQESVTRSEGKPTVVPIDHPGERYVPVATSIEDDFDTED